MGAFIAAGGSSADYWNSTPREVAAVLKAAREQDKARWQMAKTQGWLTAALTRTDELPALEEILEDDDLDDQGGGVDDCPQAILDHKIARWGRLLNDKFGGDTVQ